MTFQDKRRPTTNHLNHRQKRSLGQFMSQPRIGGKSQAVGLPKYSAYSLQSRK